MKLPPPCFPFKLTEITYPARLLKKLSLGTQRHRLKLIPLTGNDHVIHEKETLHT